MLRLFVCFLLLVNITPVFAAKTVRTTRPFYYNPTYYQPMLPSGGLNALENLAFGAVQNGDLDTRYRQVEHAILNRPKYNAYRNTFRNVLGNYIAGQATGVTPSILTQDLMPAYATGFAPQYTNSNVMQYSSFPFGGSGYRIMNNNYGTNSSIRMLP